MSNFRRWARGAVVAAACMAACAAARADRLELVAGGGVKAEGRATECRLDRPFSAGRDRRGTLYISEEAGRVLAVDRAGRLRRIAGILGSGSGGDGGPASDAQLAAPHNIVVLPSDDVLVADTMNHRIRRISARSGRIAAFAGTGTAGYSGDGGPALQAEFGAVYCLALDARRSVLYVDDLDNRRIRSIDMRSGIVSTAAGNGKKGTPQEGAIAVDAPLVDPRAIAVDSHGRLYILERGGNALRVVDENGLIRTVCGTGKPGPASDGDAETATLSGPKHLAVDRDDNVIIADTDNHVIRKLDVRERRVTTIAGTGAAGEGSPGRAPLATALNQPHGVYVERNGDIIICDSLNNRVLRYVKE
ncbi:MAG TPA: hypothetical protein VKT77_18995 [Chthonomonadaceae bacterium]|nr:hypothetical protein [Chthonomonadaceae bacterium]